LTMLFESGAVDQFEVEEVGRPSGN
jgi:hypothetical protein